jgi:hypothetical protein
MKMLLTISAAALFISLQARADIIAGPITNPSNGHDYYLLSANMWTESEREAENLGGTLAIVRSAAENEWIFSTFSSLGGTNRTLWIGLYRGGPNRSLMWVTGEKSDYSNWAGGQPDDAGGRETYVFMASANHPWSFPSGAWNDFPDYQLVDGSLPFGVVEVPGKADEESLTDKEKALIGTWYHNGNEREPCWIAGTENKLFAISYNQATQSRIILTGSGFIFAARWRENGKGEILEDKILWSDGTWWSRTPMNYEANAESDGDR